MNSRLLVPVAAALLTSATFAQLPGSTERSELPRDMTVAEAAAIALKPLTAPKAVTSPPSGPVHCVAEYEPMEAIVLAYEGSSSWKDIVAQMAREITTTGNADAWVVVDNSAEIATVTSKFNSYGVNMARVDFKVVPTDSIWIRDYGPRYIYQGDVRAIVDHTYNRPRPLDNSLNSKLGPLAGHRVYELGLVHGGGNYHLSATGASFATTLIEAENPGLSSVQIKNIWSDYQNLSTMLTKAFPTYVDSTQHIDMWMQIIDDMSVLISDWPNNPGSIQDNICDSMAAGMTSAGYTVTRVPARSISGTHYTYTNLVMCNSLLLLPRYTNSSMLVHNTEALNAISAALPSKTIVQINCQGIVTASGVMHCIVQHVPEAKGAGNPTAYMISLNGGDTIAPASQVAIEWISDDNEAVTSVDLAFSSDAGATFANIATGLAPYGFYSWTAPSSVTTQGMLRVTAHDGAGNLGSDQTDTTFVIGTGSGTQGQNIAYGTGKPGTNGMPVLSSSTPPNIGSFWTADLANALGGSPAWLIFGYSKASTPFDGGTMLVNYTSVYPIPTDGAGASHYTATIPSNPGLVGLSVFWQAGIPGDPGASGLGWSMSNGLETLVGQ